MMFQTILVKNIVKDCLEKVNKKQKRMGKTTKKRCNRWWRAKLKKRRGTVGVTLKKFCMILMRIMSKFQKVKMRKKIPSTAKWKMTSMRKLLKYNSRSIYKTVRKNMPGSHSFLVLDRLKLKKSPWWLEELQMMDQRVARVINLGKMSTLKKVKLVQINLKDDSTNRRNDYGKRNI